MRLERISGGLILIVVGMAFLLNTLGYLSWDIWASFGRFWPIFLIALGVSFLTGRRIPTGFAMILAVIVVLALGYAAGYGRGASWIDWGRDSWIGRVETRTINEPLGASAQRGELKLDFEAARLNLQGGAAGFVEGDVEVHRSRREFRVTDQADSTNQLVIIRHRGIRSIRGQGLMWNLKLTDRVPLDIDVDAAAVDGVLDLSTLQVQNLKVDTGAGDLKITFGTRASEVNARVDAGAAKVTLVVPQAAGLKLKLDQGIGTSNIGSLGLVREDGFWVSPDFDRATTRIFADIDTGAGKVQIERVP